VLNAYSKLGGTEGFTTGETLTLVDGVFDIIAAELPRLQSQTTPQSVCVLVHAFATAGQHRRLVHLPAIFAHDVLSLDFGSFSSAQLSMLAVSFA